MKIIDKDSIAIVLVLSTLLTPACMQLQPRMQEPARVIPTVTVDSGRTITSDKGVVACVEENAARIGARVLGDGGNAVDAAVAIAFALAVTHPQAGNIGGGGFMLVRTPDDQIDAIDYRETAPLAFDPDVFLDENGRIDPAKRKNPYMLVGTPGTIAGLFLAHRRHGRRPWNLLIKPAIDLAMNGFEVSPLLASDIRNNRRLLLQNPTTKSVFFHGDMTSLEPGEVLKQPELGAILKAISHEGVDVFYRGWIADSLVRAIQAGGGLITKTDFVRYEPKLREAIRFPIANGELIGMPPPSSGGIAIAQILGVLERFKLLNANPTSPVLAHVTAEAMRFAFRDRALHVGDPDFTNVPVKTLISKNHIEGLHGEIDVTKATPSERLWMEPISEGGQTTHFSVIDKNGMAVANTYTLEMTFGGGVMVDNLGFLLNNELGDFNPKSGLTDRTGRIGTAANLPDAGKRPLSSMTPAIFVKHGKVEIITGSPGGRTIINTVAQVLYKRIFLGLSPTLSVWSPRLHHQWLPDRIMVEENRWPDATTAKLREKGHKIVTRRTLGSAQSIFHEGGGRYTGVGDMRRDGWAAAPNLIVPPPKRR